MRADVAIMLGFFAPIRQRLNVLRETAEFFPDESKPRFSRSPPEVNFNVVMATNFNSFNLVYLPSPITPLLVFILSSPQLCSAVFRVHLRRWPSPPENILPLRRAGHLPRNSMRSSVAQSLCLYFLAEFMRSFC